MRRLDARVVSVGNLQAGGAGKTPLVAWIANEAHARGLKVCILTRGYGGSWEQQGGVICPEDRQLNPSDCGDEPALLHDRAPHAVIAVGADRAKQFEAVKERFRFDIVLLDDGFQHWKIKKDLEIVALTSAPRSRTFYRDWSSALRHAHLVIWTKGDRLPDTGGLPMARVHFRLRSVVNAPSIWLVTGVADGVSVVESAREAGYRVERHVSLSDHARYSREEAFEWIEQARRVGAKVALTGKDWVKWRALGVDPSSVDVLEPELEWVEGKETCNRLLWGS